MRFSESHILRGGEGVGLVPAVRQSLPSGSDYVCGHEATVSRAGTPCANTRRGAPQRFVHAGSEKNTCGKQDARVSFGVRMRIWVVRTC